MAIVCKFINLSANKGKHTNKFAVGIFSFNFQM